MAFHRHIIGIDWRAGEYSIISDEIFNTNTEIDWTALEVAHPLLDVGGPTLYDDRAIVLSPEQLRGFVRGDKAREFVEKTCKGAFLFLIHRAEWESGIPDD